MTIGRPIPHRACSAVPKSRSGNAFRFSGTGAAILVAIAVFYPTTRIANAGPITADFRSLGTFFTEELVLDGLVVRNDAPLGPLGILNFNGLGTYYTRLERYFPIQIADEFEFDFSAFGGVTDATIQFSGSFGPNPYSVELDRYFVGNPNPVTVGYSGGSSIRHLSLPGTPPLERLVLRPVGSTVRVGSITYTPVPEPSSIALAGVGVLFLALRAFRRRVTSGTSQNLVANLS